MAPKKLYIVRHAQGYHSVAANGSKILDPALTPRGEDECRELCKQFQHHDSIEMLVASPMRRTIQTTLIAFAPCIERGLNIVAMPQAQEASDATSDTGSSPERIRELFGDKVDLSHVEKGWNSNEGQYAVEPGTIMERARNLRRWLKAQKAREIVVVDHGKIAHFLTGDVNEKGEQTTGWWVDAEVRTFEFAEGEEVNGAGEDEAMILETKASIARRERRDSPQHGSDNVE